MHSKGTFLFLGLAIGALAAGSLACNETDKAGSSESKATTKHLEAEPEADFQKKRDAVLTPVVPGKTVEPEAPPLQINPSCGIRDDLVWFETVIETHQTKPVESVTRDLWFVQCKVRTRKCGGGRVMLDPIDYNAPNFVVIEESGLSKLGSLTGSTANIQWGPAMTFTIDLEAGQVLSTLSSPRHLGNSEGRGSGPCQLASR